MIFSVYLLDNATHLTPASPATSGNATEYGRGELTRDELTRLYAYPDVTRPWLRINFVASIDGAIAVDGSSGGLGTPADKSVFGLLRQLADVVVVGAGTARAENYGGVRTSAAARDRRITGGLAPVPPVAVVSARAMIDPDSRLFTDTAVPPVVVTSDDADPVRVRRLTEAGADVVVAGERTVTSAGLVGFLAERGFTRVLCEGGPGLVGQLIADDVVDELCLTTSPLLVGGGAARLAVSDHTARISMAPAHVLSDTDGTILTRWVRVAAG